VIETNDINKLKYLHQTYVLELDELKHKTKFLKKQIKLVNDLIIEFDQPFLFRVSEED
jgi:hypothetical protein